MGKVNIPYIIFTILLIGTFLPASATSYYPDEVTHTPGGTYHPPTEPKPDDPKKPPKPKSMNVDGDIVDVQSLIDTTVTTIDNKVDTTNLKVSDVDNKVTTVDNKVNLMTQQTLLNANQYTDQKIANLEHNIQQILRQAKAGIAAAMAMSSIPYINNGKMSFGVAAGYYAGQSALSGGVQFHYDPGIKFKIQGSFNQAKNLGIAAGIAFSW